MEYSVAYGEMIERIRALSPESASLFAAGCAYRVLPIVDECGTAQTAVRFRGLLDQVLRGEGGQAKADLVGSLQVAPELEADSAEQLHYWVHHSLALLFEAAAATDPAESVERCEACCALALNIAGDFDAVLSGYESGPQTELPPAGPHERLEMQAQSESIQVLTNRVSREQAVHDIEELSQTAVSRFGEAMPEFFRSMTEL
ncbi:hypothetical protein [Streptomyces sp. MZ04]|uniref:hypothetical protein n=1 Tax=Streptomyces sp. MZ04 TaxID=2559236 RepID=UPI00107EE61F|nr:hypothetical protein [Streptomyces sp. MZ04]TGA90939.1 hypothetical protein E2651_38230 [Streptomyces sp. MZ04]